MTHSWIPLAGDDELSLAFATLFDSEIEALYQMDFEADRVAVQAAVATLVASPDFADLFLEYMARHMPGWERRA